MDTETKNIKEEIQNHANKTYEKIDALLLKTINRIEDMRNRDEDISGVSSGFPSLDKLTYGWQLSDLIVLAARPSMGKTAFALNLALKAALNVTKPTPVAYFSLEMSSNQIVQRMLSAESEIWVEKINRGKLEEHEMKQLYKKGIERLNKAPIYIDDSGGLNIKELEVKCREFKTKHNIGLIFIDYLQLIKGLREDFNREQDISRITRDLKALSKELRIPIIVLSQLSREVEKRGNGCKVPQLSDLRDSGSIEQDADIVMFLYRPEYYDITANEHGESNKGETYVKIAKNRNGSLDTIKLRALLHIQKFVEDYEGSDDFGGGIASGRSVKSDNDSGRATLYIQRATKMNEGAFDYEAPF